MSEEVAGGAEVSGPPRGADLVREAMARAKADARGRSAQTERGGRRAARETARAARPPGDPVALGAAVADLLADRGWDAHNAAASVVSRWESLVGAQVAAHCRPTGLRNGELVIEAESTAWATQLRLLSRTLTATLRDKVGGDVIRSLIIRGPSTPDWRHGRLRVTGGRGPRDTYG